MLAFVAVSRLGQVLTANNINNTKACQHLTTLRMFLNTKRTLGPNVNVIVLYSAESHTVDRARAAQQGRALRRRCPVEPSSSRIHTTPQHHADHEASSARCARDEGGLARSESMSRRACGAHSEASLLCSKSASVRHRHSSADASPACSA